MDEATKIEAHKLKMRIGVARSKLKAAYQANHRVQSFDVIMQAHLHCRRIVGIDSRYKKEIDELEHLEEEYERLTGNYFLPRWRVKRQFMSDIVDGGGVKGDENLQRAAEFMVKIDQVLECDDRLESSPSAMEADISVAELLHPEILASSWAQLQAGHLREAVLNAVLAIGDLIRERTGLTLDGKRLSECALSVQKPHLIMSNLETESGRNDQVGFMNIIAGVFVGVRNPKAHSLQHDLNKITATQYLVFASLLARRIAEARHVEHPKN